MSNKLGEKQQTGKEPEPLWQTGKRISGELLELMISVYMLLIIAVMPFYNQEGFTHIGTDKAVFFRKISITGGKLILPVLAVYLILCAVVYFKEKKRRLNLRRQFSVTDIFALLYGISLIVSYLCSDYKENALWGANGWYMGLLPHLILLAVYFLVSRLWQPKNWMFLLFLPVSAVVFLLGYLNRFGIYPIDMQLSIPGFISTIGNINWYCGYMVSVFFAGVYLLWQSEKEPHLILKEKTHHSEKLESQKLLINKVLLMAYVGLGAASLITQGSNSGLVALAAVLIVLFCLSAGSSERMKLFWQIGLTISGACLATLFIRVIFHGRVNLQDRITDLLTYSVFPLVMAGFSLVFLFGIIFCERHGGYPQKLFRVLAWIVGMGSVLACCVASGLIIINTMHPGSLGCLSENTFFTFSNDWGSSRGATWKAGWMCFAQQNPLHKLVGVGPDSMAAFLYGEGSEELKYMVQLKFEGSTLANAHNEWLTMLVNTGILGTINFVGMMVSAMVRFLRQGRNNNFKERVIDKTERKIPKRGKKEGPEVMAKRIIGACGLCLLAYIANNLFSFQQSMNTATIFVILGIGEAYARSIRLLKMHMPWFRHVKRGKNRNIKYF